MKHSGRRIVSVFYFDDWRLNLHSNDIKLFFQTFVEEMDLFYR